MKLYRYEKYVLAKPMSHKDAEHELGCKIPNLFYGEAGYLVEDVDTKEQKWIPKSVFEKGNVLYDTTNDKIRCTTQDLEKILQFMEVYAKEHSPLGELRTKLFVIKRHIKSVIDGLIKLIEKE